jgi:AAA domain
MPGTHHRGPDGQAGAPSLSFTERVIAARRQLAADDPAGETEAVARPNDPVAYWDRELARPLRHTDAIDAADLLALNLPPLRWIVPDCLPEGTTILAAPPKVGKSCAVYQLVVEAAVGGDFLGRRVTTGSALYLALEDGLRRGQDRLRAALHGRTMPRGRLEVRWTAPLIGTGLEESIAEWLDGHPDAAIVAIDTLGKLRARADGRRNAYQVDVEDLGRLQSLFRDRRVALVIVHHSRKDVVGDDFVASVSGTYGISGSADTIIRIERKRLEEFGKLVVTGRDVPEAELSARFDGMLWHAAPASLPEASFARTEVYRVIEREGPIYPKAIADHLGYENGESGRASVAQMVAKLVSSGAVVRTTKGYAVVPTASTPDYFDYGMSNGGNGGHAREDQPPLPPPCPDSETYAAHRSDHYMANGRWSCHACEVAA